MVVNCSGCVIDWVPNRKIFINFAFVDFCFYVDLMQVIDSNFEGCLFCDDHCVDFGGLSLWNLSCLGGEVRCDVI